MPRPSGNAVLSSQRFATESSPACAQNRPMVNTQTTASQPAHARLPRRQRLLQQPVQPSRRHTDSAAHARPNSRTRSTRTPRTSIRRHCGSELAAVSASAVGCSVLHHPREDRAPALNELHARRARKGSTSAVCCRTRANLCFPFRGWLLDSSEPHRLRTGFRRDPAPRNSPPASLESRRYDTEKKANAPTSGALARQCCANLAQGGGFLAAFRVPVDYSALYQIHATSSREKEEGGMAPGLLRAGRIPASVRTGLTPRRAGLPRRPDPPRGAGCTASGRRTTAPFTAPPAGPGRWRTWRGSGCGVPAVRTGTAI